MAFSHQSFAIRTSQKVEAVDVTSHVNQAVGASTIHNGIALISLPHATAAVFVNENEKGLVNDILRVIQETFYGRRDYQHDRIDDNAAAHLSSAFLGSSLALPVAHGTLVLGTWQRVFVVELDGPRSRTVHVTVIGED